MPAVEEWEHIFAFHVCTTLSFDANFRLRLFQNKVFFTQMNSAYRSICANYLTFQNFLNRQNSRQRDNANVILRNLSEIISRFSDYSSYLQTILDVSSPTELDSYDGLCTMALECNTISDSLAEVGRELRTMWCFNILRPRLDSQTLLNEDALGNILHDDCILVDPASGQYYSVFLFEKMLICCTDHRRSDSVDLGHVRYPVKPWEIGPALAEQYPLVIMLSIPTNSLASLHCIDTGTSFRSKHDIILKVVISRLRDYLGQ